MSYELEYKISNSAPNKHCFGSKDILGNVAIFKFNSFKEATESRDEMLVAKSISCELPFNQNDVNEIILNLATIYVVGQIYYSLI